MTGRLRRVLLVAGVCCLGPFAGGCALGYGSYYYSTYPSYGAWGYTRPCCHGGVYVRPPYGRPPAYRPPVARPPARPPGRPPVARPPSRPPRPPSRPRPQPRRR